MTAEKVTLYLIGEVFLRRGLAQTRLCQHRPGRPNTDSPVTCFILCSVENDVEVPVKDMYEGLCLLYVSKLLTESWNCEGIVPTQHPTYAPPFEDTTKHLFSPRGRQLFMQLQTAERLEEMKALRL